MRHANPIAKLPLPTSMAFTPVGGALIPPARFATPNPIHQFATRLAAIALPAIVQNADVERPAAQETLDFDEVDRIRPTHAARVSAANGSEDDLLLSNMRSW